MNDDLGNPASTVSVTEVQRALLRLDAVLSLHFAQEEELYHNLDNR